MQPLSAAFKALAAAKTDRDAGRQLGSGSGGSGELHLAVGDPGVAHVQQVERVILMKLPWLAFALAREVSMPRWT